MDPEWTQNGPKMDPKWTQNGPKMDPKWTQNGPKMDPKWTQNGPKMDPKWTQFGHGTWHTHKRGSPKPSCAHENWQLQRMNPFDIPIENNSLRFRFLNPSHLLSSAQKTIHKSVVARHQHSRQEAQKWNAWRKRGLGGRTTTDASTPALTQPTCWHTTEHNTHTQIQANIIPNTKSQNAHPTHTLNIFATHFQHTCTNNAHMHNNVAGKEVGWRVEKSLAQHASSKPPSFPSTLNLPLLEAPPLKTLRSPPFESALRSPPPPGPPKISLFFPLSTTKALLCVFSWNLNGVSDGTREPKRPVPPPRAPPLFQNIGSPPFGPNSRIHLRTGNPPPLPKDALSSPSPVAPSSLPPFHTTLLPLPHDNPPPPLSTLPVTPLSLFPQTKPQEGEAGRTLPGRPLETPGNIWRQWERGLKERERGREGFEGEGGRGVRTPPWWTPRSSLVHKPLGTFWFALLTRLETKKWILGQPTKIPPTLDHNRQYLDRFFFADLFFGIKKRNVRILMRKNFLELIQHL